MAGVTNKNRKYGKNLKDASMKTYNNTRRDLKNKALKMAKHLKRQPNDLQAVNLLKKVG